MFVANKLLDEVAEFVTALDRFIKTGEIVRFHAGEMYSERGSADRAKPNIG